MLHVHVVNSTTTDTFKARTNKFRFNEKKCLILQPNLPELRDWLGVQ